MNGEMGTVDICEGPVANMCLPQAYPISILQYSLRLRDNPESQWVNYS